MNKLLSLGDIENKYLALQAALINLEVSRVQRGEQAEVEARAKIHARAELALDILGSRDEVEAWLEAATEAAELSRRGGC